MGASGSLSPWAGARAGERTRLAAVMAGARDGEGGAVIVVDGPPGIGKSAVVTIAAELAPAHGLAIARAAVHELEAAMPYAMLRTLFDPFAAGAFEGEIARALGRGGDALADAEAPARVVYALYELVAELAVGGPLVILIDDAHWSDVASLRFLLFLAHRAARLGVVLVVALRGEEAPELRERLLATDGARLMQPAPLGADAVGALLGDRLGRAPDARLRDACWRATGGVPLLVVELVEAIATLSTGDVEADLRRVAELAPERVTRSVALRLAAVSEDARRLARSLAILGDGTRLADAAALAGPDTVDGAASAAGELVAMHLLDDVVPLAWRHPLLQVAALAGIPGPEQAVLRRRAAHVLHARGADAGSVAAQLLLTEPAGEAWAVATLCEAAAEAQQRGAPDIAASLLRRARDEDVAHADELLLALGRAELAAGEAKAIAHMREAMRLAEGPAARVRLALELAEGLTQRVEHADAAVILRESLDDATVDDELWLRCIALLAVCERYAPAAGASGAEEQLACLASERAGDTPGERYAIAVAAINTPGSSAEALIESARLVRRSWPDGLLPRTALGGAAVNLRNAYALDEAEAWLERILDEIRPFGRSLAWMQAVGILGGCLRLRGDLPAAERQLRHAHDVCVEMELGYAPTIAAELALVLVERGALDEAGALLRAGDSLFAPVPDLMLHNVVLGARAALADAEQRDDDALELLLELGARLERWDLRRPLPPWRSSAALLLARRGEHARARALAHEELALARAWGGIEVLGIALRGVALVAAPVDADLLADSIAALEGGVARLELARSLVELGAATRRAGRRVDSRAPLQRGMELAHRCGAGALAERARSELQATGARPRSFARTGVDALTPAERRVSELAAAGRTNRQIAAALFVSVDTVETHLRHVFQKLEVRSRDEISPLLEANLTGAP